MSDLTAAEQRFLLDGYRPQHAAEALRDDDSAASLRQSMHGAYSAVWWINTTQQGIEWSEGPGGVRHVITWARLRAHREAQPQVRRDALAAAMDARAAEERRYLDAMDAIHPSWYRDATDEQRRLLDAETERHWHAAAELRAAVRDTVAAMLPLATTDEPTDLIEWAAALTQATTHSTSLPTIKEDS